MKYKFKCVLCDCYKDFKSKKEHDAFQKKHITSKAHLKQDALIWKQLLGKGQYEK